LKETPSTANPATPQLGQHQYHPDNMGHVFVQGDITVANKLLADAIALGAEATQAEDHALYSRFANLQVTVQGRLNAGRFVGGSILEGRTKTLWSRLPSSARRKTVSWPMPMIQALTPAELREFTATLREVQWAIHNRDKCLALRDTAKKIRAAMSTSDDMKRYFDDQRRKLADLMATLKTSSPTQDVRLPQSVVHVSCASKHIKLGEDALQEARNVWHATYPQVPLGH
jgi:hypothetical protein